MSKFEKLAVALLGAIAIEGAVTAVQIVRAARYGLNIELTLEQADSLAMEVNAAREAALSDIAGEGEGDE